jgi:acyl carrier protein
MGYDTDYPTVLKTVWSEVLGGVEADTGRNFFELGGDSLAGMRLMARLYESLGIDVPVRVLFENPKCRVVHKSWNNGFRCT